MKSKIYLLFLFLHIATIGYAQYRTPRRATKSHMYIPVQGDTIAFYPINDYYQGNIIKAYTCLYTPECLTKGFKPKYRYKIDENGYTPEKKVLGYMYVESIEKYYKFKKDTYFTISLIKISNGERIILAIPYNNSFFEQNAIEQNWKINEVTTVSINIPFYKKSDYDYFKSKVGQTVFLNRKYDINTEAYDLFQLANQGKSLSHFNIKHKEYKITKLAFASIAYDLSYPNLFLQLEDNTKTTYLVPVTYGVGNIKKDFLMSLKMENIFDNHFISQEDITNKINNIPSESKENELISKFKGQVVYYGEGANIDIGDYYRREIQTLDGKRYNNMRYESNYKCLDFTYLFPTSETRHDVELFAILEDSCGVKFRFPAVHFNEPTYVSTFVRNDIYFDFDKFFILAYRSNCRIFQYRCVAIGQIAG